MILRSLSLHGFKSFPDKITLNFGKGITAVVGPNGSGKSNISDAIRWVLGEQSSRSLRGSKMEDVIFGGTEKRKAQGYAEVSLCIDNTDRSLDFDNDEVLVTRRYYRSGESEYKLNNNTVRLRDVHELFMDTGLGRDGYSIISQGKIADIVSSKTEDRREIFEEAAGISKYRYRKTDAERRLDRAEENYLRLMDILSELEGRIEPLKIQSEKAKAFLELENEKRGLEIGVWLDTLEKSKSQIREQEHKILISKTQYDDAQSALQAISTELEVISMALANKSVAIDDIRRRAKENEELAVKTEGEIAVNQNTKHHNNGLIERLSGDIEEISRNGEDFIRQSQQLEEEIREIEKQINEADEKLRAKENELYSLTDESNKFGGEIASLRELSLKKAGELANLRVAQAETSTEAGQLKERFANSDEELAARRAKVKEPEAARIAAEDGLHKNSEKITELQNAAKGYAMRVNSKQAKYNEKLESVSKLENQISVRLQRAQLLSDLEKNLEGFAYSTKAVLKEASRGTLTGICGVLSRLIKSDKEYSTAIEIALGQALQNIVVDTEADAKRAIAFLKKNNAGRTTFLPVSSIKGRKLDERGIEDQPGVIGIAAELITVDSKYRAIADNLLGRTVVTEDLDSAVAVARKYNYRFKMVTLDGQVVNAGGSLTGGSLGKASGLLSRASEIAELKKAAEKLKNKLSDEQRLLESLKSELAAANADYQNVTGEITTAKEDKIKLEAELDKAAFAFTAAQAALSQLENEKSGASERVKQLEEKLTLGEKEITALQSEIEEIDLKTRTALGEDDRLKIKRDELSELIGSSRMAILELKKDIEAKRGLKQELSLRESGSGERIDSINREIDDIKKQNENLDGVIASLEQKVSGLRDTAAKAEEQIQAELSESRELEKRQSELRTNEREKTIERERLGGEINRLSDRRDAISAEYDNIINRLFDEYELTVSAAQEISVPIEDITEANRRLSVLRSKIKSLGNVNLSAIEEYKEVSERYEFLKAQLEDVEKSKAELMRLISELTTNMEELFSERFVKINRNFSEVFKDLFGGGNGQLVLTDPDNVLESGIDMQIQPPGKKVQNIDLFSGGEKSLIAIALYFAILKVSPAPFCVLDEIEAALDDVNVDRYAQYLRSMTDNTQFITITHRRGTMEEADMLYGVTMQEKGVSKLLSLNLSEVAKKTGVDIK